MTSANIGPCEWPVSRCTPFDNYGGEPAYVDEVEDAAKFILWIITGQKFGECDTLLEAPPICACSSECGHNRGCAMWLPGPVSQIISVTVDGVETDEYFPRGDYIVRATPWPRDVSVRYLRGLPPPAGAGMAVSALARELMLARCNNTECRLPNNLRSRTRNGDTIELAPVASGKTNIPMVDLWTSAAIGLNLPSSTWTPDIEPDLFTNLGSGSGSA